ncbi:MAG: photosystem II reaction center protein J [Synechococcaceae bacterium WB6_3A_227]|nr:photosystem II reaction center protein J [Synechococcaceae bacterium WB6_3A_227]
MATPCRAPRALCACIEARCGPSVPWRSRWTEGPLPLWLVATAGGMAVIFVVGLFFYGAYVGVGSA